MVLKKDRVGRGLIVVEGFFFYILFSVSKSCQFAFQANELMAKMLLNGVDNYRWNENIFFAS